VIVTPGCDPPGPPLGLARGTLHKVAQGGTGKRGVADRGVGGQRARYLLDLRAAITVRALLARAQATDALGDSARAQRLAAQALSMARPEHLRRPFLESRPWLRRLLRSRPDLVRGHGWLPVALVGHRTLVNSHEREPDRALDPLSEREREVLERLAQMVSTDEIAADLRLSVKTVKSHLKSIYRKLAVTRRGDAVRRAREADLL
jgi:LuxR family maltose regulon positive regulatory protein